MRDNGVVYIPRAFSEQSQFSADIDAVARKMDPHVLSITPLLGEDWDGESAVFFQVVIDDKDVSQEELLRIRRSVRWTISMELQPMERWGVHPYYQYRMTSSEAARDQEQEQARA